MSNPDLPRPYDPDPGREDRPWNGSGNGYQGRSGNGYDRPGSRAAGYRDGYGRARDRNGNGSGYGRDSRGTGRRAAGGRDGYRGRGDSRGGWQRASDAATGGWQRASDAATGAWQRVSERAGRGTRDARHESWQGRGPEGPGGSRDWRGGGTSIRDRIPTGPRTGGQYRGDGRIRGLAGRPGGGNGNGRGPGGRDWRPRRKGDWWRHWTWKKALSVAGIAAGTFTIVSALSIGYYASTVSIPTIDTAALQQSSTVYFSNGKTLVGSFGQVDRQVLPYNQIPPLLREAAVAAEDKNFYHEGGISPTGIMRAAYYDITQGGAPQGGSTITQELVRNYYNGIGFADTMSRKIKEIFIAQKLAQKYSKQWILTHYLNTVYFGQGAWGVQAAAETYFGLPATKLNLSQDAMIAAMPQQPSVYSPNPKDGAGYQGLVFRWRYVISTMLAQGYITKQQASQARFPKPGKPVNLSWGGYRGYIMDAVRNELESTYHISLNQIENGGLHIVTTFSPHLMKSLNAAVKYNENLMKHNAPPTGIAGGVTPDGLPGYVDIGAVLENPSNGAIEAMYAGPPYSPKHQYNYAMVARNQVGSSFKPYVLAAAVKQGMNVMTSKLNGYSPLWIPPDSRPNDFASLAKPTSPGSWYQVQNDEVSNPSRPVSVVEATALSLNTAYTDLWHRVAYNPQTNDHPVTDIAKAFGVNVGPYPNGSGMAGGPNPMQDEAGIALGQASLTVEEQATMIATLADNGIWHTPHVVQSVSWTDMATGTQITKKATNYIRTRVVLTPQQAADVDYAMSFDTAPMGTAAGLGLTNGQTIIAKTGTTNLSQQAFFMGATPMDAMAVGMFVNKGGCNVPAADQYLCSASNSLKYNPNIPGLQTLFGVGGLAGYGGQWPALIWHTFFMKEFNGLPVQQWPPVNVTGMSTWNLVNPQMIRKPKPKKVPVPLPGCQGFGRHCRPVPTPPLPTPTPAPTTSCGFVVCPTPTPTATSGKRG